ncbi:ABC transporter substrate-binding protein [Clostridium cochlearium]|uniref:ABC transporter substrate-binding protein n=1 Tax=Clostridium cochlearium TaxID=1494 RepID=UPI00241C27AA|nr:ABC transporter substrate-binding protein [Clostridium cochlearium]MBE6064233.1 ABC transporter substrate-binding protein [Clostridium cochlearium]
MYQKIKKSGKSLLAIIVVLLMITLTACTNKNSSANKDKSAKAGKEMTLKYSKGFSIKYIDDGIKKVTDGDNRTLILVSKGKEVPEEYKNEIIINTPIDNVLLGSTIHGCLLRAINEIPSVTAVTTKQDQWQASEVAEAMKKGNIKYVGQNKSPDYEMISKLKPSMSFLYSGPSGLQPMMQKFDELKLNYATCNGYLEEHPLGRMEWIKFIAAFYDKEDVAEEYFDKAVKKVEETSKKVANEKKPKVAWGMISKGKVYAPKPGSYVAKMIEMAGGDYVFKDEKMSNGTVTLEEFHAKSKDADILIYSSLNQYSPTLKSVIEQAPILEKIKPVVDKRVWCFHPNYYQSVDKTDELITDLAAIFHPDLYKDYDVTHYIKYTE